MSTVPNNSFGGGANLSFRGMPPHTAAQQLSTPSHPPSVAPPLPPHVTMMSSLTSPPTIIEGFGGVDGSFIAGPPPAVTSTVAFREHAHAALRSAAHNNHPTPSSYQTTVVRDSGNPHRTLPPLKPAPVVNVRTMTWLCYIANVSLAAGVSHYPVLLTSISADFSLNAEEAGQASSFLYIGLIVSCVVLTPLAATFGEKIAMLCCLMSTSFACIAESISASYSILCGAMFLQGLGSGGLEFLLSPIVASMYRDSGNVTAKLSLLHSFFPIGTIGTSLAATAIMSMAGWRAVPLLIALLPATVLIFTARENFPIMGSSSGAAEESAQQQQQTSNNHERRTSISGDVDASEASPSSPSKDESMALAPAAEMSLVTLLENRTFWFVAALVVVFGMCEQGPSVWLPDFVQGGLGFSETVSGYSLSLYSLCMTIIRVIAGRYGAEWNPYRILVISGVLQFAFTLAAVMLPSPWLAYGAATLTGCGVSLLWPTTLSIAAIQLPTGGTKMFGILAALANAGDTLMALSVGWVADESKSMKYAFATGMAPGLLMALMAFVAHRCILFRQRKFLHRRKARMSTDDVSALGGGGSEDVSDPHPPPQTLYSSHRDGALESSSLSPAIVPMPVVMEDTDSPTSMTLSPQMTHRCAAVPAAAPPGESPRNDTAVREHLPAPVSLGAGGAGGVVTVWQSAA